MDGHRLLLTVLTLAFGLTLIAHAQADNDAQIIEQDYSVTTVEDRRRAVAELTAQAAQLQQSGQLVEAARTLNRVARFQMRLILMEEAVKTFQAALKLLDPQADIKTYIDSLNGLASSYENLSKCNLAEPSANKARSLSTQNRYVAGEAEAILTLSFCQNLNDHALALESAQKSLELWRSINRKRGVADVYMAMYQYHLAQSDLVGAGTDLESALALYRELNSVERQTTVLIYYGFLEYRKGAWQNALQYHTQAQSLIDEKTEPYKMAQIAGGIGETLVEVGMPESAEAKFREALQYFSAAGNQRGVVFMEWSIGKALYFSGKYQAALDSLSKAREQAEASNDSTVVAFCDDFLGRTYSALNDEVGALKHFDAARKGYAKAGNAMELARTWALMGGVYKQQGKTELARKHYQIALERFRGLSDQVNESATLYALGGLELEQNNPDGAEKYLRDSIDVTENMRRISTSRDLTAAFSATVHDRYQTYVECLMRRHQSNPRQALDVRAFEVSDLARARSLVEMLRATQANLVSFAEPVLTEREMSLRQSLRVKEDARVALLSTAYKKEDLELLNRELTTLESEYKRLTADIGARYPAYEQLTRPSPLTLAEIQERALTDDRTLLLEYSVGQNRSYLWAVTRTQISSYELPGRAEIEKLAFRLHELLTGTNQKPSTQPGARVQENEPELATATAALSNMLLGPVAKQLGAKRLLIVADGALQYIPFQVLTPPVNGTSTSSGPELSAYARPLILDHEIVNEPSAAILALAPKAPTNGSVRGSVAVLADPVFQPDDPRISPRETSATPASASTQPAAVSRELHDVVPPRGDIPRLPRGDIPRLLASRDEAKAIMSIIPWQTGFEAVDFDASRSTVTAARLDQYRIVHFATHAFIDEKRPESSGIMLSLFDRKGTPQDGFLRLNDIYNLRLPVNLVVLSACQTGLGRDVRGEGLIGLTRGFMYAGASGVVASLWKVDDEATAELMKRFYRGMFQDDLAPAAALRQAQIAMWQQKRWHAPYYWAGFVIQGRSDQQGSWGASNAGAQRLVVIAAALSFFLLAACLVLGRRRSHRV